ncbi:transcription-repair coupling factor [Colwellia hornerae]|uniref:Transcription-repair-coupling factor n=1 Tax=Colwellia hornerae TaxID=89402 RepID=A0A5C6QRI2_9GAMM|nr:transcription-repair coupling factor [Colwellia hornerae]TWX55706.1 transcription-repair coupling factor [Colwellia hornerae]TWX61916.1 transcription-repair coupling factor [Colwellia hornerae]TWX71248.1 transcription-repair coupling factor [Colwellia hornerae]
MSKTASLFEPVLTKRRGKHADKKHWTNLLGSSDTLAIYHGALNADAPMLLLTNDTQSALRFEQELKSLNKKRQLPICLFPDWETLPYDTFSPHQDIISQRLATLYQLSNMKNGIIIVPVSTLLQRLAPTQYLRTNSLIVKVGDKKDLHQMRQNLEASGYRCVEQVMEHGEFSARGAILDLFPMGCKTPFRLDFFDDEIDDIRLFDPENQRSSDKINEINLLPAHEFPTDEAAISLFRRQYREEFPNTIHKESIYHQVSDGILPAGIEYYLPLFFEETSTLCDYLGENTRIMLSGDIDKAIEQYWLDIDYRFEERRYDLTRPLLAPKKLFLNSEEFYRALKPFDRIAIEKAPVASALPATDSDDIEKSKAGYIRFDVTPLPDVTVNHQLKQPFELINNFIHDKATPDKILFVAESQGRRESVLELLERNQIKPQYFDDIEGFIASPNKLGITVNTLSSGFIFQSKGIAKKNAIALITEDELLGERVKQSRRRTKQQNIQADAIFKNLAELSMGQPVVHFEHGIGRYMGLQTIENSGITTEFLVLIYAGESKLYVPVGSLHLISRYSGADAESAPLHKLGNDTWSKAKQKAAEKVRDVAAELLDIYASRASNKGYQFKRDKAEYQAFSDSFPFEETFDQEQAIKAVVSDMLSDKAMDRLVCGDVGFGKTEVAMRAAFVAVNDGKQVAILVPTTLLAQQHYENFRDRFANLPVAIEVLSRFKTAKEQNVVIADVESGQIDILIGTHKLLQNSIKYKDLGLLVVDEEHRFGVKQKEKIKQLRSNVDILTLTATPIPRTLNMAMGGMRDLSIIATPPAKRLAVKTFVRERDDALIRESILREILRGGQVYFLHNNVDTIDKTAADIQKLLPEAKVTTAHGQMRERELERIMGDFYHQRYNVLVCTTIIETGIDVPTANTIIMDRADHLGLAQLHQLRGRVGRSHHQAYAYLLTPDVKRITKDAKKRLEAIASLEDLGAGFTLATHDLEIRGAGELLGEGQSGSMSQIGFTLYMEMLDQAVSALKQGKQLSLENMTAKQTEIELRVPALLPDDYIFDVSLRLSIYKRIASCGNKNELDEIQVELIDRFGLLPQAAKNLVHIAKLRLKAQKIGVSRIEAGPAGGSIEFSDETKVDPMLIIGLIQQQPKVYKLVGANKLQFKIATEDSKSRFILVTTMLNDLVKTKK